MLKSLLLSKASKIKLSKVKEYWEKNPIFSFEFKKDKDFFKQIDLVKKNDVELFTNNFWQFDKYKNSKILDVGCGTGWYSVQYAKYSKGGGKVYAVDLTRSAIKLVKENAKLNNVKIKAKVDNAENLDFKSNYFDLVISSGVLHHTPNILNAFSEISRVLKNNGTAKLTFYKKNILFNKKIFLLVILIMKIFKIKHPSQKKIKIQNQDDFIRQYDGPNNPLGIGLYKNEWISLLKKKFIIEKVETHYFPLRFVPFKKIIPKWIHYIFDKVFGTMIYFQLKKSKNVQS